MRLERGATGNLTSSVTPQEDGCKAGELPKLSPSPQLQILTGHSLWTHLCRGVCVDTACGSIPGRARDVCARVRMRSCLLID